jgi:hypothetical protein
MRSLSTAVALITVLGAALPTVAPAQSAKDVIDRMVSEYERRAAGVRDYTLVQEGIGMPLTMYFEKETVNGKPVFRLRHTTVAGHTTAGGADEDDFDLYESLPELTARAAYKGRETVDGQAVHVIAIDDLRGVDFGRGVVPKEAEFQPRRATILVDTKLSVPRRMILEGSMRMEGKTSDVTTTMDMLDYREVQGMLHPFRTQVKIAGAGQAVDPEMRKQYEEMKKQLAEMPESQRKMMEDMMKSRFGQIEKMMSGEGGMNIELVVKELRVNQGPPAR